MSVGAACVWLLICVLRCAWPGCRRPRGRQRTSRRQGQGQGQGGRGAGRAGEAGGPWQKAGDAGQQRRAWGAIRLSVAGGPCERKRGQGGAQGEGEGEGSAQGICTSQWLRWRARQAPPGTRQAVVVRAALYDGCGSPAQPHTPPPTTTRLLHAHTCMDDARRAPQLDLLLNLVERKTGGLGCGGGLSAAASGDGGWPGLIGSFTYSERNFLGLNQRISASAEIGQVGGAGRLGGGGGPGGECVCMGGEQGGRQAPQTIWPAGCLLCSSRHRVHMRNRHVDGGRGHVAGAYAGAAAVRTHLLAQTRVRSPPPPPARSSSPSTHCAARPLAPPPPLLPLPPLPCLPPSSSRTHFPRFF